LENTFIMKVREIDEITKHTAKNKTETLEELQDFLTKVKKLKISKGKDLI